MRLRQLICCTTVLLATILLISCASTNQAARDMRRQRLDTLMQELEQQMKTPNTNNRVMTDAGWQFRGFVFNHTYGHIEIMIYEVVDHKSTEIWARVLKPNPSSGYYDDLNMPYTKEGVPNTRLHERLVEDFHKKYEKLDMPWLATIWLIGDRQYLIAFKSTEKKEWQYELWELDSKAAYVMDKPFVFEISCNPDEKKNNTCQDDTDEEHECEYGREDERGSETAPAE